MAAPLAPKLALARAVGALSRLRGGGGTSVPGKVLMRLEPGAIRALAAQEDADRVANLAARRGWQKVCERDLEP